MPTGEITRYLQAWGDGDPEAIDRLFPLVYAELRRLARSRLRGGRGGTLSSAALVHEAYLKLVDQTRADVRDRSHFFAIASKVMRRILVDQARRRGARKRGGGDTRVELDEARVAAATPAPEVVAIDEALERLEQVDPRLAQTVELRFFGGLSVEETAAALGISEATVKRDWSKARLFLYDTIAGVPG
ncbi:MAG TPA: ECF-type sigma factor [Thermoanaerobaculia bacterium]|nr:ECF-type sigma factor [Thermoanaerobaculia bacterium]